MAFCIQMNLLCASTCIKKSTFPVSQGWLLIAGFTVPIYLNFSEEVKMLEQILTSYSSPKENFSKICIESVYLFEIQDFKHNGFYFSWINI